MCAVEGTSPGCTIVLEWRLNPTYSINGVAVGTLLADFDSGALHLHMHMLFFLAAHWQAAGAQFMLLLNCGRVHLPYRA
jgi:hypothetical protein